MSRVYGENATLLLKQEETYGTPPSGDYHRLPFVSSTLGKAQPLQDQNLLGRGRDPSAPLRDAVTVDGDIVVPMDVRSIGHWLKGAFGAPVTTGSGPYTHSFRSGGTSLPSFAVEVGMPEAPDFPLHSGCKVGNLSFEMRRRGLVDVTVGLIGKDEVPQTVTKDATPLVAALLRFEHFHGSLLIDGAESGNIVSCSLSYSNALNAIESIKSTIEDADPGVASATGSLVMRYADKTLVNKAVAAETCTLAFGYSVDGHSILWEVHQVHLSLPRRSIPGPGGVQVTYDWLGAKASSPARMVTVTLVNDVASY